MPKIKAQHLHIFIASNFINKTLPFSNLSLCLDLTLKEQVIGTVLQRKSF